MSFNILALSPKDPLSSTTQITLRSQPNLKFIPGEAFMAKIY